MMNILMDTSTSGEYQIQWGDGECRVTARTWHDAVRCAFHGVVAWDRVPNTANGIPAGIIVTGGSDTGGGMVSTLKNAIETVLGMTTPAHIQISVDRVEATGAEV